jgi:glycerate kinase
MKKIILAPDSFKGTMSSRAVCDAMRAEVNRVFPEAQVVALPVADGGEGSAECFLAAMGGEKVEAYVAGVFGEPTAAYYALLPNGTAVVEMAVCAGLPLAEGRLNPMTATTYGVGELIQSALERGAQEILLCLGGSATNDGGCGMAAALGARFLDGDGRAFVPTGGTLSRIARIDVSGVRAVNMTVLCDIDNPMFGPTGAAHVFAPQKGADAAMVEMLDLGLRHLNVCFRRDLGMDLSAWPGGGAAGALGAGAKAFFGAKQRMGIEAVLDLVGFDGALDGADAVFTGEGRIDGQSLRGKVVVGVARRAKRKGVPVVALVGAIGEGIDPVYDEGVSAVFSINTRPMAFEDAKGLSVQNTRRVMNNILRLMRAGV